MHNTDSAQTKTRPQARSAEGSWWRFDSYEIRGAYICPTPGAKVQWYDHWKPFHELAGRARQASDAQPPYQDLLNLVDKLEFGPATRFPEKLTKASQELIVQWCQRHGPLGILLSRWEALFPAPQKNEEHGIVQKRYSRAFGDTVQENLLEGDVDHEKPMVILRPLIESTLSAEAPEQEWLRFFPSVPRTRSNSFDYPEPYSHEFVSMYAERLSDFCHAAKQFADTIRLLSINKPPKSEADILLKTEAVDVMNHLRRSVNSVLYVDAGVARLRVVAPSLLASFAEMAVQDIVFSGEVLRNCACCGTPFVSPAYQALYCSVACRLRDQKRRLRRQMREAALMHARQMPVAEIARTLGQDVAIVRGWIARTRSKEKARKSQRGRQQSRAAPKKSAPATRV